MLIETIEHEGVHAVFTERSHSDRLAQRVTEETGAELVSACIPAPLANRAAKQAVTST